ncbi:hypothetical protein LCGC14_1123200 [marine sediment metagenome]|uniref:Uncharacterized protein n=1 Tax=marine sediment metagenome TaxID=412755 RepID=A0A0F9MR75_9ZZZZ|tara:strand:+ start:1052 stop:1240 length:189 start_codon:yes stop_codon:yes gene_type:complete
MSLEQVYWIAGIIVAVAAVIALFRKIAARPTLTNRQDANVSGHNNTVNQNSSNISSGESKDK